MKKFFTFSAMFICHYVYSQSKVNEMSSEAFSNVFFDDGQKMHSALRSTTNANANVIYGIVDSYTKQSASYTKVTVKQDGKPITDNDILPGRGVYRKKGNDFYKLNYSQPLDVRYFGALGNGINDDSKELQDAFNYCSSLGITADCGSGLYKITKGLIAGCSIIFDAPTYGSKANAGLLVAADGIIALTITPGIRSSKNITIHGEGRKSNGIFINNNILSRHENIRVFNLNGYGFKGEKINDSQLDNISIELCGSEKDYAFMMLSGNDTWNTTTINRLQVEQSKFKGIYFDPLGLSCVINNIHAERSTGIPNDGQPSYVFGGNRCQYNTMRVQSASAQKVLITASNSTYINCLFEKELQSVTVEGINGLPVTLIGTESQCPFQEKTNQKGKIVIYGGTFLEIQGYHNNAVYNDANIESFVFGFSSVPAGAYFRGCNIGTIKSDKGSTVNLAKFEGCTISNIEDLPQVTEMINTIVKAGTGGVIKIFYRTLNIINSTISANLQFNFGILNAQNSTVNGNLIYVAGPQKSLFSDLRVTGNVATSFLDKPEIPAVKGMKHDIIGKSTSWLVTEKNKRLEWDVQ